LFTNEGKKKKEERKIEGERKKEKEENLKICPQVS